MERLENISKPTNIDDKTASFDEISSFNKETNTGVNNMLNKPEIIEFVGIEIPKEVFERYKVFLELINDKIPKEEIKKNLNIEKNELIWKGDLNLASITELPENIKFPDKIDGYLNLALLRYLPKEIILSNYLKESLNLNAIRKLSEDVQLPNYIGGSLDLSSSQNFPNNLRYPNYIGGDLWLRSSYELPKDIELTNNLYLGNNTNLKHLHKNILCKCLDLEDCSKLYTIENYKILRYLLDKKKIKKVIGFPMKEMEKNIEIIENIMSKEKFLEYTTYHVYKEDITKDLLINGAALIKDVFEELKRYISSKKEECILIKEKIEEIKELEDYKKISKKLHKINKELKDRPRIVRDRLRSIFSKELWEKVVELLKEEDPDMVKFLNKK